MKRVIKCVSLVICFLCLVPFLSFRSECLDYSSNPPSYVSEASCFFIEVNTVEIGRGTIIISNNYKYDYISTYNNSVNLFNSSSSTINGYFIGQNGNSYQVRASSLSNFQYNSGSGIGYGYQDLTINNLYSSNGSILGNNGQKVYNISDADKILISVVIVISFVYSLFSIIILLVRKRSDF